MLMQCVAKFEIFADHYVFYVHDSQEEASPASFSEELDGARKSDVGGYDLGYLTNGRTICFGGCAHKNIYGIKLFYSEAVPPFEDAQRVIALPLRIKSGALSVSNNIGLEPIHKADIHPGDYVVYSLGFNLGIEPTFAPGERSGLASANVTNSESYTIVVVPSGNVQQVYGVLRGAATLQALNR